ncbi:MAG: hypothetical protein RLZZ143_538 [Cyanobacteriota bacterium]|jgi:hypothetical protein
MLFGSTLLGTLSLALALNSPLSTSEICIPIPLIAGQGNQVTKTVSQPTVPSLFAMDTTRHATVPF